MDCTQRCFDNDFQRDILQCKHCASSKHTDFFLRSTRTDLDVLDGRGAMTALDIGWATHSLTRTRFKKIITGHRDVFS